MAPTQLTLLGLNNYESTTCLLTWYCKGIIEGSGTYVSEIFSSVFNGASWAVYSFLLSLLYLSLLYLSLHFEFMK